jgi:hypothetical protein
LLAAQPVSRAIASTSAETLVSRLIAPFIVLFV